MKEKIILAGFGGQGIMLSGQLLTYAGMFDNKEVTWLPSYGPEMRGGTANCHVMISDKPISSPVIVKATSSIVMNKPSLDKYENEIEAGGVLLVNSSLIDRKTTRTDLKDYYVPVNNMALEIGNAKTANIIMMGAYVEASKVISKKAFIDAMEYVFGKKNPKMMPVNISAFEKGAEFIANYKK